MTVNLFRDAEFAKRLESACLSNPSAPALHHGRLTWLRDRLREQGREVSIETVRKWFAGEVRPRPDKTVEIAQILAVDVAWLSLGVDHMLPPRERRLRNAMADGAVNLVAGLIQMDGGYPAFPEEGDSRAQRDSVDLHAIIHGVNYALHVCLGERVDGEWCFAVPSRHQNTVVLGVVRDGLDFRIYEITPEAIETFGQKRGGSIAVRVDPESLEIALKRIEDFTIRL